VVLALAFTLGSITVQLAAIGSLLAALLALLVAVFDQVERRLAIEEDIGVVLHENPALLRFYEETADNLSQVFAYPDADFRQLATGKVSEFIHSLQTEWKEGTISYAGELWFSAYQEIQQSPEVLDYWSISWIRSKEYWQDPAGRSRFRQNCEDARNGRKKIHRIFILSERVENDPDVKKFINDHVSLSDGKIIVDVAFEREVPSELLFDVGIYGRKATGYQETNEQSRTVRFHLHFSEAEIEKARTIFRNLLRNCITPEEREKFLGHNVKS